MRIDDKRGQYKRKYAVKFKKLAIRSCVNVYPYYNITEIIMKHVLTQHFENLSRFKSYHIL